MSEPSNPNQKITVPVPKDSTVVIVGGGKAAYETCASVLQVLEKVPANVTGTINVPHGSIPSSPTELQSRNGELPEAVFT